MIKTSFKNFFSNGKLRISFFLQCNECMFDNGKGINEKEANDGAIKACKRRENVELATDSYRLDIFFRSCYRR